MKKIKQKLLCILAFMLMIIGYANYNIINKNDIVETVSETDLNKDINLGDIELVNSNAVVDKENYISDIVSNDELNGDNSNIIDTTNVVDNEETNTDTYFEETRLERDRMYSETIEIYQSLLEKSDVSQEQKSIATQEITNITTKKNGILIAENLIKNKGFEEVVILENNGSINVIVKKSVSLTVEEIAQIQNIVEKELNVDISNISITNR